MDYPAPIYIFLFLFCFDNSIISREIRGEETFYIYHDIWQRKLNLPKKGVWDLLRDTGYPATLVLNYYRL